MAKIQLNGAPYEIDANMNLEELLKKLKIPNKKVAIEINGSIAEKEMYKKKVLKKGDTVEIVHFIGGG